MKQRHRSSKMPTVDSGLLPGGKARKRSCGILLLTCGLCAASGAQGDEANGVFENFATGLCMDSMNGYYTSGVANKVLIQNPCMTGAPEQRFAITRIPDILAYDDMTNQPLLGGRRLAAVSNAEHKCLTLDWRWASYAPYREFFVTVANCQLNPASHSASDDQAWQLENMAHGLRIKSVAFHDFGYFDLCLKSGGNSAGNEIEVARCARSDDQTWF